MKIDGRAITKRILEELAKKVTTLKARGVTPALAVILVGDNPSSISYIRQKQKAAERIGAAILFRHLPETATAGELEKIITEYNGDPSVHGIIVQQPLPSHINPTFIYQYMKVDKDVDGFVAGSKFEVPVADAVFKILQEIFAMKKISGEFLPWLRSQNLTVIGRGEMAGKPIAAAFMKLGITPFVIHSKTENSDEILRTSDIIVSCVGKQGIVRKNNIAPGAILLSVGLSRDEDRLKGDYDEQEIAETASFYTPTPGGVGPVNVACLMQNLVKACSME